MAMMILAGGRVLTDDEKVALIGHNGAPLSPFEAHAANIEDLYAEAKNWCDGEPITTQAQADEVSRLLGMIREAENAAEETRKIEAKPFDDGKAEVQARYNPLIQKTTGKTALAALACKAALAPWLQKLENEKLASAAAARQAADEAAKLAAEALAAAAPDNLGAREAAEGLAKAAKKAGQAANRAEGDKAAAAGLGRAVTLRSYWAPELTDGVLAARHYWAERRPECEAFFLTLAKTDVASGKRQIPGFVVTEDRRAV